MKKEINRKIKIGRILSVLIIMLGTILMIYMIAVEDEPGALPLFLIIAGIIWFLVNRQQAKKHPS